MSYRPQPIRWTKIKAKDLRVFTCLLASLLIFVMPLSYVVAVGERAGEGLPVSFLWFCCLGTTSLTLAGQWLHYQNRMSAVEEVTPLLVAANVCIILPWASMLLATAYTIEETLSPRSALRYAGAIFISLAYQRGFAAIVSGTDHLHSSRRPLLAGSIRVRLLQIAVGIAMLVALGNPRGSLWIIFTSNVLFLWFEFRAIPDALQEPARLS